MVVEAVVSDDGKGEGGERRKKRMMHASLLGLKKGINLRVTQCHLLKTRQPVKMENASISKIALTMRKDDALYKKPLIWERERRRMTWPYKSRSCSSSHC